MKVFAVIFLAALATGAKLDRTYLPPSNAPTAGGNGQFLQSPVQNYQQQPQFGSPSSFSNQYSSQPLQGGFSSQPLQGGFSGQQYSSPVQASHGFSSQQASQPQLQGGYASQVYGGASAFQPAQRHGYQGTPSSILRYNNQNNGDGSYQYDFQADNSITQQEVGHIKQGGSAVQGGYSYTAPDGQTVSVNYVADENGFQPTGTHVNVPSPNGKSGQYNSFGSQPGHGSRGSGFGGSQGFGSGSQGYGSGSQGFGSGSQGFGSGNQGFNGGNQGFGGYPQRQNGQLSRQYLPPSGGY